MNDMEIYAAIFCLTAIGVGALFCWLFGQDGCCQDCEQGRRCRCQKGTKREHF